MKIRRMAGALGICASAALLLAGPAGVAGAAGAGAATGAAQPEVYLGNADPIGVRMGTFDQDPGIVPCARQFVASAAPWEPIPDDGLPRHPESRHEPGER